MNREARRPWGVGVVAICCATAGWSASLAGESCLVREGQPRADIVISDRPARMARLAAAELQDHLFKMSGAKLPIVTAPGEGCASHVFVGSSAHTRRLGVTDAGLSHGAFRMLSVADGLVLLGHDSDYVPPPCYFRGGGDRNVPAFLEQWDADVVARASRRGVSLEGEKWNPHLWYLWKEYSRKLNIWEKDQRGSLNAVCAFLGELGVRWYMPGELGEIVPKRSTIEIPRLDKTVRPDFALRFPYQYGRNFACEKPDEILWQLRMGFHQAPELIGDSYAGIGHGMEQVLGRDETKRAHPEYYKLESGQRITSGKWQRNGAPCLSSPGLLGANVRYVRAMFDLFDLPMVSVMPSDGYVSPCQCERCQGGATPQRGYQGMISDYVWGYVNRVAGELQRTHPGRMISCLAYGAYSLPPEKIDGLSPNLCVGLAQHRCADSETANPQRRAEVLAARRQWLERLPRGRTPFFVYDYYRYAVPGGAWQYMPVFFPHAIAADLRSLKGISLGDYIEVYRSIGDDKADSMAVTHLNLYVTARLWWDADQDIDRMLEEYYALFYGPARDEMKAFVEFSEAHWTDLRANPAKIGRVFDLLAKAQEKTEPGSPYGRRIAMVADYIRPLGDLQKQLAVGRGPAPSARARQREADDIRLDGRLDDPFWKGCETYALRETETGRRPACRTSFMVAHAGGSLYFGIRCQDAAAPSLANSPTGRDDMTIFEGESAELLLETQNHSYYQLSFSPAEGMVDIDRKAGMNTLWSSNAQFAANVGDGGWSLEIRVPLADPSQADVDPNHGVAGRMPSDTYPWYFNVARQSVRPRGLERSAFSPTGEPGFHVPRKFARLTVR